MTIRLFLSALLAGLFCSPAAFGEYDLLDSSFLQDTPSRLVTTTELFSEDSSVSLSVENILNDSSLEQSISAYENTCGEDYCCEKLLGLFAPSESCFNDFISPMTNLVFFEDPRTLTEARFIYAKNRIPSNLGGGDAQLFAMQVRAALNDRWSIVAAKDGFIVGPNGPPITHQDGWADVSAGLKYNFYRDPECGQLLSLGASYEMPIGSTRALQGNGDGVFHVYLTGGTRLGCNSHWISATGFRLPADTVDESQIWYWSNHFDKEIGCGWYWLVEVNWYHWMKSGQGSIPVSGLDLYNFGSPGVEGNDIVTGAFGFKYKPCDTQEIGFAWEAPLTDRRDIMDNRLTLDWIFRY